MTACLIYPTYNSYSSFAPLRLQGRGHHPHHQHPHIHNQEAVDLRQRGMLEDTTPSSSPPAGRMSHVASSQPMFALTCLTPTKAERGVLHGAAPTPEDVDRAQEEGRRSAFSPARPREGCTPPPTTHTPTTPLQHRGPPLMVENGSSPLSASTVGSPEQQFHGLTLEEVKQRQALMSSSPHSTIMSDNDDEYIDIDIACDKSDSSGDSPHGKRSSAGGVGGGSGGGSGEKKVYRCQHCKYITDRKNNLKRHVVTMHEMCPKTLECCDVVFKNKASLRDHVVSCHKNGYDCRICGRTFCRKALLKRHITVHSGQKDYICGVCGYATSHKSNLDRHKRRHGPKFGVGVVGEDSESPSGGDRTKSPPQFTSSHKPNPLDVSNLVSNSNSHGGSNNNSNNNGGVSGGGRYGGYSTITSIHRPEPLKPDLYCSPAGLGPLPGAVHLGHREPVYHHHHHQHEHLQHEQQHHHIPAPLSPPRRHRHTGKYILSKRLLYTYRRDANDNNNGGDRENRSDDNVSKSFNNNNHDTVHCFNKQEQREDEELGDGRGSSEVGDLSTRDTNTTTTTQYIERKLRLGLEKRMTAKRLLSHSRKLRLSTKRLFPALYMCRRCSVVYENQLQLTEHVDRAHRDEDCPHLPQRPLTLQARPRAW